VLKKPPASAAGATAAAKSLQSCPTLCDTIDGSPPGFVRAGEWPENLLFETQES